MSSATIDFYRSLLHDDPDLPPVRADLAESLLAADDLEGAIAEASAALDRDPTLLRAWLARGTARKAQCCYEAATEDFERAAALAPGRVSILVNLAHCYAEQSRLGDAETWLRRAVALAPDAIEAQASLGSILVKHGKPAEAEAYCQAALALNPNLVSAHQNLSGILAATDPAAAQAHRDAAYRQQQIFVERAGRTPARSILILAAADEANVPLRHLMPRTHNTLVHWYVEYATEEGVPPPTDLVFNAIGDPDLAPPLGPPVERLLSERHVLNHPAKVAMTRRSDLPRLLAGIPGIVVPRVIRHEAGHGRLADVLASAGMGAPVLVRPLGSHGGAGVQKCEDADALAALPDTTAYVTEYVEYVSADGWHRKYRAVFVDGQPYPYHLAIAKHWLVHYWNAGMELDAARRDEERRFLDDPDAATGAMAVLGVIAEHLGLEYGGIDFGLLPDGRVLVFEANATILVHPEHEAHFLYRNPAVDAIQAAFDAMLTRHAGRKA